MISIFLLFGITARDLKYYQLFDIDLIDNLMLFIFAAPVII